MMCSRNIQLPILLKDQDSVLSSIISSWLSRLSEIPSSFPQKLESVLQWADRLIQQKNPLQVLRKAVFLSPINSANPLVQALRKAILSAHTHPSRNI